MIYEEITTKSGKILRRLTPEPPYEWLTDKNESTYSKLIYLGKGTDISDWRDATQEEYEEWERRQHDDDGQSTQDDG